MLVKGGDQEFTKDKIKGLIYVAGKSRTLKAGNYGVKVRSMLELATTNIARRTARKLLHPNLANSVQIFLEISGPPLHRTPVTTESKKPVGCISRFGESTRARAKQSYHIHLTVNQIYQSHHNGRVFLTGIFPHT
jgi:hypothetical protein